MTSESVAPLDAFLKNLDEHYPGSKKKRRSVVESQKSTGHTAQKGDAWDAHPQIKRVHGKDVEMFHIGALAKAVGRTQATVRGWFEQGILPETPYRLPTREVNGQARKGKRLFTREMIGAVVEVFDKHRLLGPGSRRIEWSTSGLMGSIPTEITSAWKQIQSEIKSSTN